MADALEARGAEVWVKHENHTPIGAFKIRGGIVYMDWLRSSGKDVAGVITATRGNHGQSIALAARLTGLPATILIPRGNSPEKNAAMESFGATLIVHGRDFDEAKAYAARLAEERNLHFVPSFDPLLVKGVATYALELFQAVADLDTVYAPIGMGSGILWAHCRAGSAASQDGDCGRSRRHRPGDGPVFRSGPPGADQFSSHIRRWHGLPGA